MRPSRVREYTCSTPSVAAKASSKGLVISSIATSGETPGASTRIPMRG